MVVVPTVLPSAPALPSFNTPLLMNTFDVNPVLFADKVSMSGPTLMSEAFEVKELTAPPSITSPIPPNVAPLPAIVKVPEKDAKFEELFHNAAELFAAMIEEPEPESTTLPGTLV